MDTNTYKITFSGEIREGCNLEQAKQHLTTLYKGNIKIVELLFKRKQAVLKENITMEQALKVKQVFDSTGAVCQISQMDINFSQVKAPKKTEKKSPTPANDANLQKKSTDVSSQRVKAHNKKSSSLKWGFAFLFLIIALVGPIYYFFPVTAGDPIPSTNKSYEPATLYLLLN